MSSFKITDKKQKNCAEPDQNKKSMEKKVRDKSNVNRNQEIVFKNCNIKKQGQKSSEKNESKFNL